MAEIIFCPRCQEPTELGLCPNGHQLPISAVDPVPLDSFSATLIRLLKIETQAREARENLERLVKELGG